MNRRAAVLKGINDLKSSSVTQCGMCSVFRRDPTPRDPKTSHVLDPDNQRRSAFSAAASQLPVVLAGSSYASTPEISHRWTQPPQPAQA